MISVSQLLCSQTSLLVWGKCASMFAFALSIDVCCLFKGASLVSFIGSATVNTPPAMHVLR